MTWYALGATVTLNFTAPADATVVLRVTAPDGTESTPATSNVLTVWSGSFTAGQYGQWLFAWQATGTATNVDLGSVQVGEPWYSTLVLLRLSLGMASDDTTRDALLTQALASSARSIDRYCSRRFYLDTSASARTYTISPRKLLRRDFDTVLRTDDIGSTTGLVVEVGDGTTWTTITDYVTYPDNALAQLQPITGIASPTVSWCSYRQARITAPWGWPAIPTEAEQANQMQANRLYKRKDSPQGVMGSPDWGLIRVPNLDPDVKALLAPYTPGFLVA